MNNGVIMYDNIKQTLTYIKDEDIMDKLYEDEISLPTIHNVKLFIKNSKDKNIISFFTNIEKGIRKIKKYIPNPRKYRKQGFCWLSDQ